MKDHLRDGHAPHRSFPQQTPTFPFVVSPFCKTNEERSSCSRTNGEVHFKKCSFVPTVRHSFSFFFLFFFHVWLSRIIFGGFFSFLQEIFWSSLRPTATSLRKFHIRGSGESLLKPELFFSQAGIWCHNKMSSNI